MLHWFIPQLDQIKDLPPPWSVIKKRSKKLSIDFETWLFERCGLPRSTSAALSYLGDTGQKPTGFVLLAEPIYLKPDRNQILVFPLKDLSLAESQSWVELFNAHFQRNLMAPHPHRWYLIDANSPQTQFYPLRSAAGLNLADHWPTGKNALYWRSLMNEVQMLFFQSELNKKRISAGKMPVSGFWLSGGGALNQPIACPQFDSDHPVLKGLAALTPHRLHEKVRWNTELENALYQGQAWQNHLDPMTEWHRPLLIYPGPNQAWYWRPRFRYYFWR